MEGELLVAYVWWEGQPSWALIKLVPLNNDWPANTNLSTAWKVRNTGDETAIFKVYFMELESAGVLLGPGEEAWLYLYSVTPSPGTYIYTFQVIADSQTVAETFVSVVTSTVVVDDWMTEIVSILVVVMMMSMMMKVMMKTMEVD